MKYRIATTVTHDELVGLRFIADSFSEHRRDGIGTGDAADDARALAAARWIGRLVARPVRERRRR